MNCNRISFRFDAGMKEANGFIETLMAQLCFKKEHNCVLDVQDCMSDNFRHVELRDLLLDRSLLCFHEDHGVMIFTVGIPCTMVGYDVGNMESTYDIELDLSLYEDVITLTKPLHMVVPSSAKIKAS